MKKNYLAITFLTLLASFLWAENTEVKSKKNGALDYQTLEWESSGFVKSYFVTVEKKVDDRYEIIFTTETTETTYDVSLDVGSYRFKVDFRNVLGQVAFVTEYKYFDILVTYQPKISLESDSIINTKEKGFTGEFSLRAENLIGNAQFYLEGTDSSGKQVKVAPKDIAFNGDMVNLKFDVENIPAGKYRLVVQNPGGLISKSKVIKIGEDVGKDAFFLSFGYAPKIILSDDFIKTVFDTDVALASYNIQFSYLHPVKSKIRMGGGLVFRHAFLSNENEVEKSSAHLISADANLIVDYKVCEYGKSAFFTDFYCGLGFEAINAFKYLEKETDGSLVNNSFLFNYDAGIQGKLVFNGRYYVLSGIEYESQFGAKNSDYRITSLNIHLGMGVQF